MGNGAADAVAPPVTSATSLHLAMHSSSRSTGDRGASPIPPTNRRRALRFLADRSSASVRMAAVTPEPQEVMIGLSRSTPADVNAASMRSREARRPLSSRRLETAG